MYAEESVDLLQNSGLQFDRHEREGIETVDFAEMLIVSGTVPYHFGSDADSYDTYKFRRIDMNTRYPSNMDSDGMSKFLFDSMLRNCTVG